MFAHYNNLECKLVKSRNRYELISKNPNAINCGFKKDGSIFCKILQDTSEIEEIYDIRFYVYYDTGLRNVPVVWEVGLENEFIKDGKALLRFGEGLLPGWKVEDKTVCSMYINSDEINKCKIEKKSIKGGTKCTAEKYVSFEELSAAVMKYRAV